MTADFRHLARFVETRAPQDYAALRARFPSARMLASARTLGGGGKKGAAPGGEDIAGPFSEADVAAAMDFCRVSLRVVREGADRLMVRVRARIRSARRMRMGGAVLAMASSAGVAALTLELLNVDDKITGLSLSGLAFLGAVAAFMSDEMSRGGPAGTDGRSLLDRLISLQGMIAGATVRFEGDAATGVPAQLNTLRDLDQAVRELTRLQSLYSLA